MDYQGDRLEFFRIRACPLDNPIGALPNAGLKGNILAPHSRNSFDAFALVFSPLLYQSNNFNHFLKD
jgi:hypothetical protein